MAERIWEDAPADFTANLAAKVQWEDAPNGRPLKGRMANFVLQNFNKGVASVPDALLNAPTEVYNLGKAAVGAVAGAAGAKPEDLPELTPNPNLVRTGMEKVGMLNKEGEATTPEQQKIAGGLEFAGGMAVPAGRAKPGAFRDMAASAETAAAERSAHRASFDKTLTESRKLGYVVPPSQVSSSLTGNAVEGLVARTAPTERVASMKNSTVTNRVVRRDLGLSPTQPVNDATFEGMRKEAGKSYQAVKDSGVQIKPDKEFEQALAKLETSDYGQASKEYGDILSNDKVTSLVKSINKEVSPTAAVEMAKELRRRATKNLKSWDDLEKQDLGYAQRSAAEALEGLIGRSLDAAGKKSLVKDWKEARVTIAKSHDAEAAWDGSNFSAKELAKLKERGAPLSGGMDQAAEFAKHFPRASQDATNLAQKSGFSQYDLAAGAGTAIATGHPAAMAVAAAPWLTQRALLSSAGQRIFGTPNYKVGTGLRAASSLDDVIQRAALQGGIQEGQQ